MFNLAIDSKLRGCDVVSIKIGDIAPNGHAIDRATVRQRKTGRPVRFELTEQTREAIDNYLKITRKKPGEFLFTRPRSERSMTSRQYARLVSDWVVQHASSECDRDRWSANGCLIPGSSPGTKRL